MVTIDREKTGQLPPFYFLLQLPYYYYYYYYHNIGAITMVTSSLSCNKIMLFLALLIQIWCVAGFVILPSSNRHDTTSNAGWWWLDAFPTTSTAASATDDNNATKQRLLDLLAAVPRNTVTSNRQTQEILETVRALEPSCPTPPGDVLTNSAGTWELIWTAQDKNRHQEGLSPFRWINPLENQAYSNNPAGRANPILPLEVQNFLTERGILSAAEPPLDDDDDNNASTGRTSTQTIDLKNQRVVNVVSVPLAGRAQPAALTVRVDFTPYPPDPRRVNVKFQSCRVAWGDALKLEFPLGIIGPTGWLRTTYLDDTLRVTRGHKGSVFVLSRRRAKKKKQAAAAGTTATTAD
eukprot:scaffold44280_cov137-Amphora_coffeaeformis.AAC.1